eukprot:6184040-Pleurochrysis_carterae.AAC.2
MHSLPFQTCVACILAELSRSAPQALGTRAHDGRRCPLSQLLEPLRRRAPAPAPALAPSPRRFVFYMFPSLPARLDEHASSGVRGSTESVQTTDSGRARPWSGCSVLICTTFGGAAGSRETLSAPRHRSNLAAEALCRPKRAVWHRLVVDWAPVDNRAIARSGCAGANGSFAPRTPPLGGRSTRGSPREEHHPGLPAAVLNTLSGFANAQGANVQYANAQSANAQSANAQSANAQSANAQTANALAANTLAANAQAANAQAADAQAANAHTANAQALAVQAAMQATMQASMMQGLQNPFMPN